MNCLLNFLHNLLFKLSLSIGINSAQLSNMSLSRNLKKKKKKKKSEQSVGRSLIFLFSQTANQHLLERLWSNEHQVFYTRNPQRKRKHAIKTIDVEESYSIYASIVEIKTQRLRLWQYHRCGSDSILIGLVERMTWDRPRSKPRNNCEEEKRWWARDETASRCAHTTRHAGIFEISRSMIEDAKNNYTWLAG